MKSRTIFEKITFVSMGLCILILAGLSLFQYQEIRKLSKNASTDMITRDKSTADFIQGRTDTTPQNPTKGITVAGNVKESAANEINDLEFQLKAVEEDLDMTHERLSNELLSQEELKIKEKEQDEDWKQNSMRMKATLMRI